jgi:hypothetical protein
MKMPIYSLAKELKLDNMRIIADARCEGVYVTQPTDRIPIQVAHRIRAKYQKRPSSPPGLPRYRKAVVAGKCDNEEFRKLDGLTADEIQFLLSIV